MQTDACTEALLREKLQATSGPSSSRDAGPGLPESNCDSFPNGLVCPDCSKDALDFQGLVQHFEDTHGSYPQRTAKCPVCRRTARDMVPHLMQHLASFEADDCNCLAGMHEIAGPSTSHQAQEPLQDLQMRTQSERASGSRAPGPAGSADRDSSSEPVTPPSSKPEPDKHEVGSSKAGPSVPPAEASKAADPPPPQPGGLEDTPEARAAFVQQMMLGVFGIGRR